jgi:hypothetical protein
MANDTFTKIKIVLWRGIGWFLVIVFALSSIASFLSGDFLMGLIFLVVAFIGCLLTGYKRKKKNNNMIIREKNHWEEENKDNEEYYTEEFKPSIENAKTIENMVFAAVMQEREPIDVEKGVYRLVYIDAEGESTVRNIKIIRVEPGEPGTIYAYCFLRKANRIFRIDRIVALYKAEELIKEPKRYLYSLSINDLVSEALAEEGGNMDDKQRLDYIPEKLTNTKGGNIMPEKEIKANAVQFPSNISRLVNRRKELSKKHSMENDVEIFNIDEQLGNIKLFYFAPNIDLDTPKKILEMAGLFAENEATKTKIQEQLKGTDFEDDFDKTDGEHLIDGDLKEILAIRREATQYKNFRKIIENTKLGINEKLEKLFVFIKDHEKMIMDNMRISEKNIKKISEAGLTIADFMLIESFSNWGLPASFSLYIAGIRTKDDILAATPEKLLGIKGFGKQSLEEFYDFVETIKGMNDFSVDIWAFNDIGYSYKADFNIDFFNSIENPLLAYRSF